MAIRHPARLVRMYKRALTMRRGVLGLQVPSRTLGPQRGSFIDDERSHYQSKLMPVFRSGTLSSFDLFIQRRSKAPHLLLMELLNIVAPAEKRIADILPKRDWENVQSFTYQVWQKEAVRHFPGLEVPEHVLLAAQPSVVPSAFAPPESDDTKKAAMKKREQLEFVAGALADSLPKLFTEMHNYKLYHVDVVFENRIRNITTTGLNAYSMQLTKYRTVGHLIYSHIRLDVLKITQHPEDSTVRVRWRIQTVGGIAPIFQFWKLFTRAGRQGLYNYIDGFSVFSVGDDGLIHKHVADKLIPDDQIVKNVRIVPEKLVGSLVGFVLPAVGEVLI